MKPRTKRRDPLHVALDRARQRFGVGDRVRVRSSGDIGIVVRRPSGDVCTPVANTAGAFPPHLYAVRFEAGIKAVHPLLLVLIEPAAEDGCT